MSTTYTIKLPQFEGPFDLLLFFIERDELDINDIPIAQIADEFLNYIKVMESLNIDLASEFILVAATLMRIKAKMLIPRKILDEEGNEIDPREELVERLLEYKRYKSTLEELRDKEDYRSKKNIRGNTEKDIRQIAETALVDVELESLTLYKLMRTFQRVMTRMEEKNKKTVHKVFTYRQTVGGQKKEILAKVKQFKKLDFENIFGDCENRIHAIINFLALLELVNLQYIRCIQGVGINNFWLVPNEENENTLDADIATEEE